MTSAIRKTLAEIAQAIDAKIKGDPDCVIVGVATLQSAKSGEISFLDNPKYQKYLPDTKASAVILSEADLSSCQTHALIVKNPYFAYAQIAKIFEHYPQLPVGIHPTAVIGEYCQIDPTVRVGAYVVIANHVSIGKNTQVSSGCVIGESCQIGDDCQLMPRVTLYHRVNIGDRVIIHSGAVLGSDGFGHAMHEGRWHKVPQIGGVVIEEDVEIGANTTIDRGALEDTVIETGAKLDNQIQIAHNVRVGAHTVIAGCVGVAGSTKIGKYCMIGGGTGFSGHIEIADRVIVTGMSMVTNSIKEPGIYSSGTGLMKNREWQKSVARFRNLDKIARRTCNHE